MTGVGEINRYDDVQCCCLVCLFCVCFVFSQM